MDVLDRIKKLLRLAEHADSEHEAALAAERARALMAQHEIHEAMLTDDGLEVRDPVVEQHEVTATKRRVAWHLAIATPVATMYGAHGYTVGGRIALFGRLSAVQAAGYTIQYLVREIEEACDKAAPVGRFSRGYRNAWKLGYARRLAARLQEATLHEQKQQRQQTARAEAAQVSAKRAERESFDVSDEDSAETTVVMPPPEAGALVHVEKRREEVRQAYSEYRKTFHSSRSIGTTVSSGSGYRDGKAAGDRAKLPRRGDAKGRLPKGQDVLK